MNCLARGPAHRESSEADPLLLFFLSSASPWSASWEHILYRTEPGLGSALATALDWELRGVGVGVGGVAVLWTSRKLVPQPSSPPTTSLPVPFLQLWFLLLPQQPPGLAVPASTRSFLCCSPPAPPPPQAGLIVSTLPPELPSLSLLSLGLALDPHLLLLTEAILLFSHF